MNTEYLGYLKYEGNRVSDGYLDARKSAEALLGFDEALRYFVGKQSKALADVDFEIPVRVEKGSWVALIPQSIGGWVLTAFGAATTAYVVTAATKMADHDFKEIGIQDMFRKALMGMQWLIRIGKHLGSLSRKTFQNVQWRNGNEEIGIPNNAGEYLFIPKEFFDLYVNAPQSLLAKVTRIVIQERTMVIALCQDDGDVKEEVSVANRSIFCQDNDDLLFPELIHGMDVSLEGLVTRGNENSNTIGFQHNDHILTCFPMIGSVVGYKHALFVKCRIRGIVTRANRMGEPVEPRPKIMFTALDALEETPSQPVLGLFDEEK